MPTNNATNKIIPLTQDEGVTKEILQLGNNNEKPPSGSKVTVHYVGQLEDGTIFDSSRERNERFDFDLGRGQVIKGWDIGVASMTKGEKCRLICSPEYAYGEKGYPPHIPRRATLEFEIELFDFDEENDNRDWTLTFEEKIKKAQKRRQQGNDYFSEKQFGKAASRYEKATALFDFIYSLTSNEQTQANQEKLPCLLNLAACQLKLGEYRRAMETCDQVLQVDAHSSKALFRKGKACRALSEYGEAEESLSKALKAMPDNKGIQRELKWVHQQKQEHERKQKKMFGGMFS
eukprot:gb/GECH01003314.1/.p1 GENE.gb/GECH01003314.1/~~gb/GECH01003314.1/.p1  ORF type:complete len:290 (+),score=95.38 gb/GECH01003314.1/:1-870(+)